MWGRTSKQRRSAVRRGAEIAEAERSAEVRKREEAQYLAAIRAGQRRAKARAAKSAVKFATKEGGRRA